MSVDNGVMVVYGWTGLNIEDIIGQKVSPQMVKDLIQRYPDTAKLCGFTKNDEYIQTDPLGVMDEMLMELMCNGDEIYHYDSNLSAVPNYYFGAMNIYLDNIDIQSWSWSAEEMAQDFAGNIQRAKDIFKGVFNFEPTSEPRLYVTTVAY